MNCLLKTALTLCALSSISLAQSAPSSRPSLTTRLDILDVSRFEPDVADAQRRQTIDGNPFKIAGATFAGNYGISTYANATIVFGLNAQSFHFSALFGVDDESAHDSAINCKLLLDGKPVAESGTIKWGDAPKSLAADLSGVNELTIEITNVGAGHAHADIMNGIITYAPGTPRPDIERKFQDPGALDIPPIASGDPDQPEIHGPRVTGTTPGHPFLFLIPATGKGALTYAADGLPAGLALDSQTGIISGAVQNDGIYAVLLTVTSNLGKASQTLTIVAGKHKLAQTPPMGWNSWNAWGPEVSAQKIRDTADAMVKLGLAARGFQYVNIDDYWEGTRGPDGIIQPNERFGDMKALADYVHSKGLRLGIYSSPGPQTCGKNEGSYQHELDDAKWFAKVGFDYLKYDWCSYGSVVGRTKRTIPKVRKPYQVMGDALDKVDRDIVYSLCEYGMGNVWQWGAEVNGNVWRTTSDITDMWTSVDSIGFNQARISRYSNVGHWNDPDMLVVGKVSWGAELHPSRLTPDEQLTHITLWSMLSAPLLLGCDMTQMDKFTLDLISNPEVLDIDQDQLGRGGEPARIDGQIEIWKKSLFDGATAVAIFNRGRMPADVNVRWSDIGLNDKEKVRDLWQRKDLGDFSDQIQVSVPRHGAVLLKVGSHTEPHF